MARLPGNNRSAFFRLSWILLAGLASLPAAGTQSLLLHLRNGDRLSGSWVAEDTAQVTLSNSIVGKVSVPLDQIAKREIITNTVAALSAPATNAATTAAAPQPLSPETQRRLADLQAAYLAGRLGPESYHQQRLKILAESVTATNAVPAAGGPAKPAAPVPAVAAKPAPAPAKPAGRKNWSGEVFFGTDLAFSERNRQLFTGRFKLTYTPAPLRNHLDYLFTYGRTDGVLSANRMDGLMKTDLDLNSHMYLYSLGAAGYDEIRKIDWRYELGPGVGYHLIKRTNFVMRLEGGFHYQVQNFEGNRQEETYYHRLAQDSRWNIGTQFSFDQKIEYLPELDDFQVYKLRFEANVRYWLRANLSLNFTVIDLYDTVTAKGVGQNDLQLRSSIGVKF